VTIRYEFRYDGGGLGKGGKSYYAIDVTDPASMSSEAAVASQIKWEFTDSTMGYSFGAPVVVKVAKYGWVVALTSGYNNSDGYGYVYLVNPSNGVLLEKLKTILKRSHPSVIISLILRPVGISRSDHSGYDLKILLST